MLWTAAGRQFLRPGWPWPKTCASSLRQGCASPPTDAWATSHSTARCAIAGAPSHGGREVGPNAWGSGGGRRPPINAPDGDFRSPGGGRDQLLALPPGQNRWVWFGQRHACKRQAESAAGPPARNPDALGGRTERASAGKNPTGRARPPHRDCGDDACNLVRFASSPGDRWPLGESGGACGDAAAQKGRRTGAPVSFSGRLLQTLALSESLDAAFAKTLIAHFDGPVALLGLCGRPRRAGCADPSRREVARTAIGAGCRAPTGQVSAARTWLVQSTSCETAFDVFVTCCFEMDTAMIDVVECSGSRLRVLGLFSSGGVLPPENVKRGSRQEQHALSTPARECQL